MNLDVTARATALRLIARLGKTAGYISVTDGIYNPATGAAVPTETTYSVKAIVEEISYRSVGAGFMAGLVREGDKKIIVAASGVTFTPKTGDKFNVDGVIYEVLNFRTTYSGELVALFEVHGRR